MSPLGEALSVTAHRGTFEGDGAGSDGARITMSSRLSLLVDLASLLGREVDLDALMTTACERVATALAAERATVWLVGADAGDLVARLAVLPELPELRIPATRGLAGWVARTGETVRIDDVSADARFDASVDRETGFTTRSILAVPVRDEGRGPVRGVLQVLNRAPSADGAVWDDDDERYLAALALQIGRALALTTLRAERADGPGVTLRGPFNRIVGRSRELFDVYERVGLAAQTDATVLLRGASGTGKGVFARAIHVNSSRQTGPFVTVDCTTLPLTLVESELFGHERGAFTGADRRVPGKVELASGGTLFLDEIGDMPPEAQGKLLRLLQDRAFERVGGRTTLSADARILCATHQDLERLVREGRFRADLYYRVRVVEIEIPSLASRGRAEVEALARHFADMYARRYGRPAPTIRDDALEVLAAHDWPGNVRELEHWIESAVVLSPSGVIGAEHLPRVRTAPVDDADADGVPFGLPLDEATRRYVEAAVRSAGGNKAEAARKLGVGRNTIGRILRRRRDM